MKHVAEHPIRKNPYDKVRFSKFNHHGIPLYAVRGVEAEPAGAFEALARAFKKFGGRCFYCARKFEPQPLSKERDAPHRDHVFPSGSGGKDHLHNLVIACGNCGHAKGPDPIHDFRPKAAHSYLSALHLHISECIKAEISRSAPPN